MQQRPQTYNSSIHSFDYSANGQVVFLRIKIESKDFVFKEGQFIMMHLPVGDKIIKRSYSICTTYSEYLEYQTIGFIIKYVENGLASEYFFQQATIGEQIEIIGALGHMILPENTGSKRYILLSTGSGFSPVYGIFQKLLESKQYQSIIHLYGEKTQERLVPKTRDVLSFQSDRIHSQLCLSREEHEHYFHGYVGQYLQQIQDGALGVKNGEEYMCYVCGKPEIVDQLTIQLLGYGIPKENIKSEKY